jgi:BspA type Leucine rich repeat region (6 copies)
MLICIMTYTLTYDNSGNVTGMTGTASGALTIPNITPAGAPVPGIPVIGINSSVFSGKTGFITLNLSGNTNLATIGTNAFSSCSGFGGILDLSGCTSLTLIDTSAFIFCSGFSGLILPPNLITIGDQAFRSCGFQGNLTIPNSVINITGGQGAFYSCTGLTGTLTIPNNSIAYYGPDVFGLTNFTSVSLTFITPIITTTTVQCLGNTYFTAPNGSPIQYNLTIGAGITSIASSVFSGSFMKSVIFPTGFTQIGNSSFYNCYYLSGSLSLPSVTNIGISAFQNCSGFHGTLSLPSAITIGVSAFDSCTNFTGSLTIPNTVTTIDVTAFYACAHFSTLSFASPCQITSLDNQQFNYCSGFTGTLIIPDSLTSLGVRVFANCSGFTGLTFPANLTSIGSAAFKLCSGLLSLTIPNTITSIGSSAFNSCSSLATIVLPSGLTLADSIVFTGCVFTSVTISYNPTNPVINSSYRYIGSGIATNCTLTINSGITAIGDSAFQGCGSIKTLTIAPSVTSIGVSAFLNCSSLGPNLNIPYVQTIADNAFYTCTSIKVVNLQSVTTLGVNCFSQCAALTGDLSGNLSLPSIVTIGDYCFNVCNSIKTLSLPTSLTTIGKGSFLSCYGLTGSLTLPTSLISLGDSVFQGCTSLNGTLTIPSGLTFGGILYINSCVFTSVIISCNPTNPVINSSYQNIVNGIATYCTLTINTGITTIADSAFVSCTTFGGSLTIPNTVTTIGLNSFASCARMTGSLTLSSSLTSIGSGAFQNCNFNGPLIIPNTVTSLGTYAFNNCPVFNSITLPSGISIPGSTVFNGCVFTSVTISYNPTNPVITTSYQYIQTGISKSACQLTINNGITTIQPNAFAMINTSYGNFTGSLTIPSSVTVIANLAFDCHVGTEKYHFDYGILTIQSSSLTIGANAFQSCGFQLCNIPSGLTLGANIFVNCTKISLFGITITSNPINTTINSTYQNLNSAGGGGGFPLTINSGVTDISNNAFSSCTQLTGNLTIPNTVTEIGTSAFSGCTRLTGSLSIPNGITISNATSFSGCGFNSVYITKSINPLNTTVTSTFQYLNSGISASSLNIYDGASAISASAFSGCSNFTGPLTLTGGLTIGTGAFSSCKFSAVNIPFSVNNSYNYIGSSYTNLSGGLLNSALNIANGITDISANAFNGCSGFTGDPSGNFALYSSIRTIGASAFSGCSGFSRTLSIPSGMQLIGNNAFLSCRFTGLVVYTNDTHPPITDGFVISSTYNNLKDLSNCTLTVGNGIVDISDNAFLNCSGFIGNLTLYSSITIVGQNAFSGCSGFNGSLYIPTDFQLIGNAAFLSCRFAGLVVYPNDSHPPITDGFVISSTYNNLKDLSNCTLTIGNRVDSSGNGVNISDNAFLNCSGFIGDLILYSSIRSIGASAFSGCSGLNGTLYMPSGLQLIGASAFLSCRFAGLVISLNDSHPPITNGSVISSTYNNLKDLSNCALTIGNGITDISDNAFLNCSGLNGDASGNLMIYSSIRTIGNNAFYGCSRFNGTLSIPSGLQLIGASAFYGCNFTGLVVYPNDSHPPITNGSVISSTYNNLKDLSNCGLIIGNCITDISNNAFLNCSGFIGLLNIPYSVTAIDAYAFAYCTGFSSLFVWVPPAVIDPTAFYGTTLYP